MWRCAYPTRSSTRVSEPTGSIAVAKRLFAHPVVVKVPHDEFRELFVEIYTRDDEGKRLVASVEVLSLSNKTAGERGRDLYQRKQREVLASQVHLVEIDLLRGSEHSTAVPLESTARVCGPFDYHVSVHDFDDLETFFVYPICLEDHLSPVTISLLPGDLPVTIDLQAIFDRCYDAGPYARKIHYGQDAVIPPLQIDKAAWAAQVLQAELG